MKRGEGRRWRRREVGKERKGRIGNERREYSIRGRMGRGRWESIEQMKIDEEK